MIIFVWIVHLKGGSSVFVCLFVWCIFDAYDNVFSTPWMVNLSVAAIINKALLTQCWGRCWYTQEKGNRGRKENGKKWPPAANNKASEHFCMCESISPVFPSVWRNWGLDWTHQVMLAFVKNKEITFSCFYCGGGYQITEFDPGFRCTIQQILPSLKQSSPSLLESNPQSVQSAFFHTHAAF